MKALARIWAQILILPLSSGVFLDQFLNLSEPESLKWENINKHIMRTSCWLEMLIGAKHLEEYLAPNLKNSVNVRYMENMPDQIWSSPGLGNRYPLSLVYFLDRGLKTENSVSSVYLLLWDHTLFFIYLFFLRPVLAQMMTHTVITITGGNTCLR